VLQTEEALEHRGARLRVDPGTAIGDDEPCRVAVLAQRDPDGAAARRVLDRVVEQIGDGLKQQVAVAVHARAGRRIEVQRLSPIFGDRLVELDHVAKQRIERHLPKRGAPPSRLDVGDAQQCVEGPEQAVGVAERLLDRGRAHLRMRSQRLETVAQACERGAQVVGDAVRDAAHVLHEPLDAVQHLVQILRELIEVVTRSPRRDAARQISGHDAPARLVDAFDAPQGAARHRGATREGEQRRYPEPPRERPRDELVCLLQLVHVATDQQVKSAAQAERSRAGAVRALGITGCPAELEIEPAVGIGGRIRPTIEITGERREAPIGEKVDSAAVRSAREPLLDGAHETLESGQPIALGEARDLGLDGRIGLARHVAGGGPVDEREQDGRGDPEQAHVHQGETESRAAENSVPHGARCLVGAAASGDIGACPARCAREPSVDEDLSAYVGHSALSM